MSTNYNQFLISTADVIIRDREADQIMVYGTTEMDSSIKKTATSVEIAGGAGGALLYDFQHSNRMNFTINDVVFNESYLAMNSGTLIQNKSMNMFKREQVTLNGSGVGTLTLGTPVGNVYLQSSTGAMVTVVPSGTTATYLSWANQTVTAAYKVATTVDTIDFNASNFTKSYELTLIAHLSDKSGQYAEIQIVVPYFKPDGNFDISLKMDGYSGTAFVGKALADQVTKSYGSLNITYVSGTVTYTAIAASPSTVTLSVGTPTQQLSVYGLRGGGSYANVLFAPTDCTYVSGTPTTCTVSTSGLLTRVGAGTSLITVTHTASGLKDYCNVTAT